MLKIRILLLIFPLFMYCQPQQTASEKFQKELKEEYANKKTSPLNAKELKTFKGISFFPIHEKYNVTARLERLDNQVPFLMPSTGEKQNWYKKFGKLHFTIAGVAYELFVYQNQDLIRNPKYKNHLFLPFNDLTNGETTYGGGRYIDLEVPADDVLQVDFNQAYNPYCAYSPRYSCPITPLENFIKVKIEAGVQYQGHED